LLKKILGFFLLVLLSGCVPFSVEGRLNETVLRGRILLPAPYFGDFCTDTGESEGYPLPFARVMVRTDNGDEYETLSDCSGRYEIRGVTERSGIIYAKRGAMVLAKGFSSLQPGEINEVGVVDGYTTAQVAIFEAALRLYPQSVYYRDIPNFTPSKVLVTLVEEALTGGRNPLEDPAVLKEAHRLIDVWFGD